MVMESAFINWIKNYKNVVLIGESGCGKSEISIHIALRLAQQGTKQVHLFDMDQTKPLYRSRDVSDMLTKAGVICHFEIQMMDTPTMVSGIEAAFRDENSYVVVDVGGNDTGARLIGGLSALVKQENAKILYPINPYRPWSKDVLSIDAMMSDVLNAARINKFKIVGNPCLGRMTTAEEALEGCRALKQILEPYTDVEYFFITESVYHQVKKKADFECEPLTLYLSYPWEDE